MERKSLLYEGKAKKLFQTNQENVLLVEYLDQATALNGIKKDTVLGKGQMNNQITAILFEKITEKGIANHFIKKMSKTEQLVQEVTMLPLEIVVRNIAAGSFSKRLDVTEGTVLPFAIIEFYYKEDRLDDPIINEDHIKALQIASAEEIQEIKTLALQINQVLQELFATIAIDLVDFKIEIGCTAEGKLLLADEISPDTCRLWDKETNAHLDKDVYRRDLGDLISVYREVLQRLENKGESSCI